MLQCRTCGHENRPEARFCDACGDALDPGGGHGEQRKTVTVLFCDVTGSTHLGETIDAERLRALLARYFDRMKAIVEHHGGTVEKFIGDAVMAVFGVPAAHEDDALRAVRAAVEMRDALPELGLGGRIGVMTGEVVAGTEERLATGDAVNVAARLEQAASPGSVLVGAATLALVRDSVEFEVVAPLELKGKAEAVPAYRLVGVRAAPERPHRARFVGRTGELALIRAAVERVRAECRCELVTVVGEAGVGKSRLLSEALAQTEATVVRGRCPPYGEGITYWPVVEVLKQLASLPSDESARRSLEALLGKPGADVPAEDIAWGFRKALEHAAADRPLVVELDDIQWADETLWNLVEHLTLLSSGAPVLVCCLARPELTERRPSWPVSIRLEPLGDAEVADLVADRARGELQRRIMRAAGGNPLFVEEMLAFAGESDGDAIVPPTLQALLAARLDQLPAPERQVLELAAIEGEVFHRGAVLALAGGDQVTPQLAALTRRGLIAPGEPHLSGEDGFRFHHLLIRDAAYQALPKGRRAELHALLAGWLDGHPALLVERDELVGFHLEQAAGYLAELDLSDDANLASSARRRLAAAGHTAALRQDYGAAVRLLERAAALVPAGESDLAIEGQLGGALAWMGRGDDALGRARAVSERAAAAGDRVGELCGLIQAELALLQTRPSGVADRLAPLVDEALPLFETVGADPALAVAYEALATLQDVRGQKRSALEAAERCVHHAHRAGYRPSLVAAWLPALRFFGPTPVSEVLAWLDEHEPAVGHDHFFRAYRAGALAMLGRLDEARAILGESRAELAERGGGTLLANLYSFESVWVELWAGDPAAAIEYGNEGWRLHRALGDQGFHPHAAAELAEAYYRGGRLDDAEAWAERARELPSGDELWPESLWRQVTAKVLAYRGRRDEAEVLAREGVAIFEGTDMIDQQGDAHANLAEVLVLNGQKDDAVTELEEALRRYERKGNLVSAQRAREALTVLGVRREGIAGR